MKIEKQVANDAVLGELGLRFSKVRLSKNLTQADLAGQAGVSKRTLERFEAGESLQLSSLIRVCRALDLVDRLDALIPDAAPSPITQLKLRGRERRRASATKPDPANPPPAKWTWSDKP